MKFCIIGLGYFGKNLAISLARNRTEVLAIDIDSEKVEAIKDEVSHAVILDASQPGTLARLPMNEMDAVIVAIGENFQASLLAVGYLQELGVQRIIARVIDPVHERLLRLMKIEELVHPEADSAKRMAESLMLGVVNSLSLTGGYSIVEAKVPEEFLGRSLQETGLRSRYQLNLITVRKAANPDLSIVTRRSNVDLIGVPPADYRFEAGDMLVLFGQQDLIDRFLRR